MDASEESIKEYLGYNPIETIYTDEIYDGDGTNYIYLNSFPIKEVTKLAVNDTEVDLNNIVLRDRYIDYPNGSFTQGSSNIKVSYSAGWTVENIPKTIKLVGIRIVGVFFAERNRIGVNSMTDQFSGARTYFQRQLNWYFDPIKEYKKC